MDNVLSSSGAATPQSAVCFECELPTASQHADRDGRPLCALCADAFYASCSGCAALVPKDDAASRPEGPLCAACLEGHAAELAIPGESEAKALVDEFVALNARHKEIGRRLEEVKELLKLAASARERAGNAVVIRGETGAVRCGYSKRVNCDGDRALELEPLLGPELFAELFEQKVTVKANAKAVLRVLEGDEPVGDDVREAVRSVVEVVESPTITTRT